MFSLHWSGAIAPARLASEAGCSATLDTEVQCAPASVVRHMAAGPKVHRVPPGPLRETQPTWSSTNDRSVKNSPVGSDCSCQVVPRSVERKRYWFATRAHTTLADGALNWADVGIGIGPVGTGAGEAGAAAPGVASLVQCLPPPTVRCRWPAPDAYPIVGSANTNCVLSGASLL